MAHSYCAVFKCPSSSRRQKELKFHKFPRDPGRRESWMEACRRPELKKKTVNQVCNMHVCGLHFEDYMYGKNQLKDTAIPTVNLPLASTNSVYTQTEPNFITTEVNEENVNIEGFKIKLEHEENGIEYCGPKIIKTESVLDDNETENSFALVTLTQFQQGCELYLSPEDEEYENGGLMERVSTTMDESSNLSENEGNIESPYSLRFQRTSHDQFSRMLEFMEMHGDLSRPGKDRLEAETKWKELAESLNENVSKKPLDRWRKVWADLKAKTRKKAVSIINDPECRLVLTSLEQRVMAFHYGLNNVVPTDTTKNLRNPEHVAVPPPIVKEENENSNDSMYLVLLQEEAIREQLAVERSRRTTSPAPLDILPPTRYGPQSPTSRSVLSPNQPASTPPPASPPRQSPPPAARPPPPAAAARPRLRASFRRRRPCCKQSNLFINLEQRRLKLEELRVRNQHERERERERNLHERETERLKLDAMRLELEAKRLELHAEESTVMRRLNAWLDRGPK